MSDLDLYAPAQIAERVEHAGVAKARADAWTLWVLGVLAGAFIALGGVFATVVTSGSELGAGPTRFLGGSAFSLGLVLVVVAGAELFTGNNLLAVAFASRRVTLREVARNWAIVYAANAAGATATAVLVALARTAELPGVRATLGTIASAKVELSAPVACARGVLCNALVCLAVWLSLAGRSATDKVLAIVLPIAAFVTCGFEHSIANWFFLPWAWLAGVAPEQDFLAGATRNLAAVTLGNLLGGTLLVAGVYWLAYLRPSQRRPG